MKFLNCNRVLCLSPHPDDVEYGMAGTILLCKDTTFDLLCLTCGGSFDLSTNHSRLDEIRSFWAESGGKNVNLYFSPHIMLKELGIDAWINYIEVNFVNKYEYDAILVPPYLDSHFEHGVVSPFAFALTRCKPISVIEYCSPSALETWISNLYIDISKTCDKKSKLLNNFKSQKDRLYFGKEVIEYFHFHYPVAKRGLPRVERYRILQHIVK